MFRQAARQLIANSRVITAKRAISFAARQSTVSGLRSTAFASKPLVATRGIKQINFGGVEETVYERADWPTEKLLQYFKDDTLALIGYGLSLIHI